MNVQNLNNEAAQIFSSVTETVTVIVTDTSKVDSKIMKKAPEKSDLAFDAAIISLFIPLLILFNIIFILSSKTAFEPCETPEYVYSILKDQYLLYRTQGNQIIYWPSNPSKNQSLQVNSPRYFYEPTQTGFIKLSSEKSVSWHVKKISANEKHIAIKRIYGTGSTTSIIKNPK